MKAPTDQILQLLDQGKTGDAVALIDANGGPYFGFIHGYEALNSVVAAAPESALFEQQTLLSCYCFALVKAGRVRRATAILQDKRHIFSSSFAMEMMELAIFIHSGEPVSELQLNRWRQLEGLLPVGEPLQDGLYYNCMVIILVRINLLKQARTVALRALESYRQAKNPSLEFYIHLHLAHMSVIEGNLHQARRELRMAKALVQEDEMAHATSAAFIEIIESSIAWETGQHAPSVSRLASLRDELVSGDSWAEIFIELSRVGAFSLYFAEGLRPALEFLNECQVDFNRRHSEFSDALDVIAAAVELLDGRPEHAQLYASLGPAERNLLGATGAVVLNGMLAKLRSDDVALPDTGLTPRLAVLNELMVASQAKEERDKAQHRRHVQNAMRLAADEGLVGLFLEHREVVVGVSSSLATGKFARGHIQLGRMARRIHHLVRNSFFTPSPLSGLGVTAQQMRVLSALREGASNKQIARKLGLSEAAIKYHLGQLFNKFQVMKRGQLIEKIEKISTI